MSIAANKNTKRHEMAAVFSKTQNEMNKAVDELFQCRRSAVPYASEAVSCELRGPIPFDSHLLPSNCVIPKSSLPDFTVETSRGTVKATGKPWASYEKPTPSIFTTTASNTFSEIDEQGREPPMVDEELWRTRYIEWTLQKNAYNPDVAAALRCATILRHKRLCATLILTYRQTKNARSVSRTRPCPLPALHAANRNSSRNHTGNSTAKCKIELPELSCLVRRLHFNTFQHALCTRPLSTTSTN